MKFEQARLLKVYYISFRVRMQNFQEQPIREQDSVLLG